MKGADRLIGNLILGDVADDYEEFEHVLESVRREAERLGVTVDRDLVLGRLGELLGEGLVQAYVYRVEDYTFVKTGDYSPERVGELWFYITPKGLGVFEPRGED